MNGKLKAWRVYQYLVRSYRTWNPEWSRYVWKDPDAYEAAWELHLIWQFRNFR